MKDFTCIIILNYNNWEDTINCVNSVEIFNTSRIKYIVIDNGSTKTEVVSQLDNYFSKVYKEKYKRFDYEKDQIPNELPYLSFVVSKQNDGYARGNNKGLVYAYNDTSIEYVMILNNDILFVEDILPRLIAGLSSINDAAIVSPILFKKDFQGLDYNCAKNNPGNWDIILTYLFFYRNFFGFLKRKNKRMFILQGNPEAVYAEKVEIELPSGSCMLMSKSLMQEIGGFDPNTFLYYEEPILYKKISGRRLKNYLFPNCRCIHLGAGSTSSTSNMFVARTTFESMSYYFKQYSHLSLFQSVVFIVAKHLFYMKIRFKDWIKLISK